MANQEHLALLLKRPINTWNTWLMQHFELPDLKEADLHGANLRGANLIGADLRGANLGGADLSDANLGGADLSDANLLNANLSRVNLFHANLRRANLSRANFLGVNFVGADLSATNLIGANLTEATLSECRIYGISIWDVQLQGAKQDNLIITLEGQPTITVDNLKIAQFIYLLLNNEEIRDVIDTIAKKAVLILGRFTSERKAVLDALRDELRKLNYLPILFDFEKPESSDHDITGTVETLAHLSRFIILDLTDPSSAPHEAATIIPQVLVPVQPILLQGEREYALFADLRKRFRVVLPTYQYQNIIDLLASLQEHIILPAEQKAQELAKP